MKTLKLLSITLSILFLPYFGVRTIHGFSTHTDTTSISRNFEEIQAFRSESITVTVSFENIKATDMRGFYYVDHIPEQLTVSTESMRIDGNDVSYYIKEIGAAGDIYNDTIPYRWILETPSTFDESNPINSNSRLEIVYSVSSDQLGTFSFEDFYWVGYYPNIAEGQRAAFGYSEANDKRIVTFLNNPPLANNDNSLTLENTSITINILMNDDDPDGSIDPNTILIVNGPKNGSININNEWDLTYTPGTSFYGTDKFTYTVEDDDGAVSNKAMVIVTVAAVIDITVDDIKPIFTDEDEPISIILTSNDIQEDPLAYILMNQPTYGTLSGTAPNMTYTPDPDYNGSDSFTFEADYGQADSYIITLNIEIEIVNDPPLADSQSLNTEKDTHLSITLTGSDVENDVLSYEVIMPPTNGTLQGNPPDLIYIPDVEYVGLDSFSFKVNDGFTDSNIATVSINTYPPKMDLPQGWSMISLPMMPYNAKLSELFPETPGTKRVVYGYKRGSGYFRVKEDEKLETKMGYWIFLEREESYNLNGQPLPEYSLSVNEDGWYMIGGCISPAHFYVDSCNIDEVYRYDPEVGYQPVLKSDNLEFGRGYWIKFSGISGQCELKVGIID